MAVTKFNDAPADRQGVWRDVLERRGLDNVCRLLLTCSAEAGENVRVGPTLHEQVPRGFVENWVAGKKAELRAAREALETKRFRLMMAASIAAAVMAGLAVVIAALAWLFPLAPF